MMSKARDETPAPLMIVPASLFPLMVRLSLITKSSAAIVPLGRMIVLLPPRALAAMMADSSEMWPVLSCPEKVTRFHPLLLDRKLRGPTVQPIFSSLALRLSDLVKFLVNLILNSSRPRRSSQVAARPSDGISVSDGRASQPHHRTRQGRATLVEAKALAR